MEEIKIDESFIRRIVDDADGHVIVSSAVDLVGSLGMRAVAEGVESEAIAKAAAAMGCYAAQGRYFAPPMEAVAATEWLLREGGLEPAAEKPTHFA